MTTAAGYNIRYPSILIAIMHGCIIASFWLGVFYGQRGLPVIEQRQISNEIFTASEIMQIRTHLVSIDSNVDRIEERLRILEIN